MIGIVTDSSCDIPTAVAESKGIEVVPLTIRFGEDEFTDREQLTPNQFWSRLANTPRLPETAAPSAGAFEQSFQRLTGRGVDGIVAICMSAQLSATYQAAVIAAERVNDKIPIKVVDSRAVSMALGLQVLAAAEHAAEGADLERVSAHALASSGRSNILAALDTLEYLKRGGRIGSAQALLGNILSVKPLITLSDGVVSPAGRVRTRSKAIAALLDRVRELAPQLQSVAVVHANAPDIAEIVGAVRALAPGGDVVVAELGPVVGTHSGPGTVAIAYLLK